MKSTTLTAATTAAALSSFLLPTSSLSAAPPASARPNILIILADDMGYSDLGCYGGEIHTPALDKLAAQGLRFTQFYNGARCCPSRAALLTGLYAHQAGMGAMTKDQHLPGYTGALNENCMTIAEMLRPAGYATYALGKWHVSHDETDTKNLPPKRGFDHCYGTAAGAGSYFYPTPLYRDTKFITRDTDPDYHPSRYYYTDAITDNAIKYLQDLQRENTAAASASPSAPAKPFFMYVAYTAAHWPMQALPEDIAKYKGRYDEGYNAIRAERYKNELALGLFTPQTKLSPPDNHGWNNVKNRAWEIRCMEVYAAIVDRMDQGIARIVEQLKASGQLDNTIIFFLQDNGACAELIGRSEKEKPHKDSSGHLTRRGPGVMPGPEDTFISYGRQWANVSNTPLRLYKSWVHEGGISTPLIVHWPAGIPAALDGTFIRTPGHIIDIAATCLDLAGAPYPATRNGKPLVPLAGISLRPAFTGGTFTRAAPLYWEHEGNRAIRDGDWKLVAKGPRAAWELYDMSTDRSEGNNLAARNPDTVARLSAEWEKWAIADHVKPWPWAKGASKSASKSAKTPQPEEQTDPDD